MGVPKFFRWLSERYPLINQPIHCPPNEETKREHGYPPSSSSRAKEEQYHDKRNTNLPHIMPEFDRLYLDMNGIIHCSSHNNSEEVIGNEQHPQNHGENGVGGNESVNIYGVPPITDEQIFQNVCYYVDRIVTDIVQPKKLVFLAIDGVAPRAKLNQQRSRRYRSGTEREIEKHLMTLQRVVGKEGGDDDDEENEDDISKEYLIEADGGAFDRYRSFPSSVDVDNGNSTTARGAQRFSGTIDTSSSSSSSTTTTSASIITANVGTSSLSSDDEGENDGGLGFHSNCITPGTPFLHKCSQHILSFLRDKLQNDPKWHDLTIIFSGHDVPGEGEHKIMEFIRHEKHKPNYDPNTSHCIFGQDGDLVMLGLAMHEPHTCLLREEVVFDPTRKKAKEKLAKLEGELMVKDLDGINNNGDDDDDGPDDSTNESSKPSLSGAVQSYIHNANFELLHISILREYLGLEFETKEFDSHSKFELEPTIDDFVFMTFFVGNDFLPHLPALDIGDEAFDLLFYAYKKNRAKWLKDGRYRKSVATATESGKTRSKRHPYLTDAGNITSGDRLESFLADLGSYEDPYYQNKRASMEEENERMRKQDKKYGRESLIPSQEVLERVELADRELYHTMLRQNAPAEDESEEEDNDDDYEDDEQVEQRVTASDAELMRKIGGIFRWSLSPNEGGVAKVDAKKDEEVSANNLRDLKGRYYYEKFGITPFEAEKHATLRKEYITGLVWNLEYYYKGVVSWEWYYPYNYGPMLSDLKGISSILSEVSFDDEDGEGRTVAISATETKTRRVAGSPLRPFEQLLGCLPPSSSYLLPKPYRWLMTSPESPLIDFYPESFTVDMNGKRWPWEAVALLPFIDSAKLIQASRSLIDESELTDEEKRLNDFGETYVLTRSLLHDGAAKIVPINETVWANLNEDGNVAFQPVLNSSTKTPGPSFPTLRDAPIKRLSRRKIFLNVFGLRSRYRTALLEMDDLPALPSTALLAQKFIGTTVNFRYPILYEGFVCSMADSTTVYRGNEKPRKHSADARAKRPLLISKMFKELQIGEGMTGTGGWVLPQVDVTLTVRPLESIKTLPDGTRVKVYARREIEIPFVAALFSPSQRDPRLDVPAKLEQNPFIFGGLSRLEVYMATEKLQAQVPLKETFSKTGFLAGKRSAMSARGFSTHLTWKNPSAGTRFLKTHGRLYPQRSSFHSSAQWAPRGNPRQRVVGTAGVIAMSVLFFTSCLLRVNAGHFSPANRSFQGLNVRGGDVEIHKEMFEPPLTPPVQFEHGTTTIAFVFQGGIVAAVDSRASIGNFVGSKTVQKVLPVSKNILGTMAGGAADCSFWIRMLRSEAKLHELLHGGRGISVARASRLISNVLYQNRALDLSVGTMIMGYHPREGFQIFYVDNTGVRIQGDMFAVGSGSTFALGILDTEERRFEMTEEEAVSLGIRAIRHATLRDAGSGGWIGVYLITKDGWRKVFSEDLASI